MSKPQIREVKKTIDFGQIGEVDVDFIVRYYPGSRPSGMFGPPENYCPGEESSADFIAAKINTITVTSFFEAIDGLLVDPMTDLLDEIAIELDEESEDAHAD